MRRAPGDYPIDDSDSDITALMWNGVGGGTVVYAAQWQRNMPSDFRVRTLDGVADDWPLTYEDLEPYYVRVERDFGVSGLAGDTAFPPGEGPPLPPVPLGPAGRARRARPQRARLALVAGAAGDRDAQVRRAERRACSAATCLQACADGAKGTVDRTHWPRALELGVELRTRARVRELTTAAGRARRRRDLPRRRRRRARGPRRRDDPVRQRHRHAAAAAAVGDSPDGLANSSGLVGKRLMMHPFGTVVGVFDEDFRAWQGPWGQYIHSLEFYETDAVARVRARREVGPAADRRPVLDDERVPVGRRERRSGATASRTRCAGGSGTRRCGASSPRTCRRSPTASCSTRSAPTSRASPGAKIEYRLSENSRRLVEFHQARARESLLAAGRLRRPWSRRSSARPAGTCSARR